MAGKRVGSMATWTGAFALNARTYSKYGKPLSALPASSVSVCAAARVGRRARGAERSARRHSFDPVVREPCLVFNPHRPVRNQSIVLTPGPLTQGVGGARRVTSRAGRT